jgi:tellurite resistance protein
MADSNLTLRAAALLTSLRSEDLALPDAASLRDAEGERRAATMVEAAFLLAAADGHLQAEELGELTSLVASVLGGSISPSETATMLESFQQTLEKDGKSARIQAIAEAARSPEERREILGFSALVALCDNDLAPSELFVLHSLGRAFGIGVEEVNAVVRSVRAALGQDAAPAST